MEEVDEEEKITIKLSDYKKLYLKTIYLDEIINFIKNIDEKIKETK